MRDQTMENIQPLRHIAIPSGTEAQYKLGSLRTPEAVPEYRRGGEIDLSQMDPSVRPPDRDKLKHVPQKAPLRSDVGHASACPGEWNSPAAKKKRSWQILRHQEFGISGIPAAE